MQTDRKLIMDDLGGFVDVITRKSESVLKFCKVYYREMYYPKKIRIR